MTNFTKLLDNASWNKVHTKLFTIVSLNYLLDGIMFSIAPLLAYVLAPDIALLVLAINLIAESLGAIILGRLADFVGRRKMFMLSLAIEVFSVVLLVFLKGNPIAFLVLTSLLTFGIGGEFGAAYSIIAELIPSRIRGRTLVAATNFWNVGAALFAGLALYITSFGVDVNVQVNLLLTAALITGVVVGVARFSLPESPRWLVIKNEIEKARRTVEEITGSSGVDIDFVVEEQKNQIGLHEALTKYWFRFLILAIITVTQYVTYGMLAYYVPYAPGFVFGVDIAPKVVFIANLGASIGGLALLSVIDKSRKNTIVTSFLAGFITAVLILLSHGSASISLFFGFLFINLFFSEWAWGGLSTLQSELFPTGVRASVIGLLTSLTGISGAIIVYGANYMDAEQFLVATILLWFAGFLATIAWRIRGIESARKSIEETSSMER